MNCDGARHRRRGGGGGGAGRSRRRLRPAVEALKGRTLLATYTVDSTLDDVNPQGTLPWAVAQANANGGADAIEFASSVFGTPQTITLSGGQLTLTDRAGVTVNGP